MTDQPAILQIAYAQPRADELSTPERDLLERIGYDPEGTAKPGDHAVYFALGAYHTAVDHAISKLLAGDAEGALTALRATRALMETAEGPDGEGFWEEAD